MNVNFSSLLKAKPNVVRNFVLDGLEPCCKYVLKLVKLNLEGHGLYEELTRVRLHLCDLDKAVWKTTPTEVVKEIQMPVCTRPDQFLAKLNTACRTRLTSAMGNHWYHPFRLSHVSGGLELVCVSNRWCSQISGCKVTAFELSGPTFRLLNVSLKFLDKNVLEREFQSAKDDLDPGSDVVHLNCGRPCWTLCTQLQQLAVYVVGKEPTTLWAGVAMTEDRGYSHVDKRFDDEVVFETDERGSLTISLSYRCLGRERWYYVNEETDVILGKLVKVKCDESQYEQLY